MAATGLFADLPYNAFAPFTAPPPTTPSPEAPSTTTPKISPPTTLSTTGPATTAPKMGPQMGPPHPPPMGPPHPRHMKGPFGPSNPPPMGPSNPPHMKGPLGPSNPPPMGPPHPPPMGPPHPRHMKGPFGPSNPPPMGPPHPPPMGPPHPRHMKGPFGPSNPPPMGPSNPPHMKGPLGPSNPPPMGPPHPPPMGPPHPRHMKGPLGPSHPPPTKGPATTKPKMGPPNPPPTKGPHTTAHNVHASTPYWSWSAIQKIPPARPGSHAPTTHAPVYWSTPLIHWDRHDTVASDIDLQFPKYNYKFVFVDATPPPVRRAIHTGALVVRIIGGAVGFFLTLVILSNLKNRKQRSRRGIVLVTDVAVEQNLQPEWRPPFQPEEPGPLNNDMPPSYQECALYSVSKEGGEAPPPYTVPEHHKQLQGGFIDSERRACAGEVAPGMRTELVFDSGRVVERLSVDATSDNKKKKEDSNDDVENQRTTEVDLKDKVVYSSVNETRK